MHEEANKAGRIAQVFTRAEEKPASWLVRFKLDVQACNPSCPSGG